MIHVDVMLLPVFVLHCHRLAEVPKGLGVGEVQDAGRVVGDDERQHRVLHQVVVGAPREPVQPHQVLPVGDGP